METTIADLETPCLTLDRTIFNRNLETMESFLRSAGKRLRPHAKTHRCSRIARQQLERGAVGISVAKTGEALGLIAAGVEPVLITGPVVAPSKLDRLAAAVAAGHDLTLALDSVAGARRLEEAAARRDARVTVLIDVDPGLGRTGVRPDDAPAFAALLRGLPHLDLRGIQSYLGSAQHIRDHAERRDRSLGAMRVAQETFRALRRAGHRMEVFTGAGTGTFDIDVELPDLTDLQAGSYALMDAQYLAVGSREDPARFRPFGPALRVYTMVLSSPVSGQVTVDAGLKALYRDTPPPLVLEPGGLTYEWFGDEYGRVRHGSAPAPAIGDILAIVPAHCDPTVNLYDRIQVVDQGRVVDTWPVDLRGLSQ